MRFSGKKETLRLFIGDIALFLVSLWVMLFLRYRRVPDLETSVEHLIPFSILFIVWILVFFISGLYEKHTLIIKHKLPTVILNAQIANIIIAVFFFYFVPYFEIAPKTNLFIYLIVSFLFIFVWRTYGYSFFEFGKKQSAILIGSGNEMKELRQEVNDNTMYNLQFVSSIDLDKIETIDFKEDILNIVYSENINIVVVDLRNEKVSPILPGLYNLIFSKVKFIDMHRIYEDIFNRIPLSLVKYSWFLENISLMPRVTYDSLKRLMDVVLSFALGALSLLLYPFIILAIKLEDGGHAFFIQERVGKNNKAIRIIKFRTMEIHHEEDGIAKIGNVTKVGLFLRKTRFDEFPQLWNVLKGDLSLIGPRPEIPTLVKLYEKEIPYYDVRHLIKPGLSGWAQLYQENPPKFAKPHGVTPHIPHDETRVKLSYDLYYIKNHSFLIDISIALKTISRLLSRSGA